MNHRKQNIRLGALFAMAVLLGTNSLTQLAYIGNPLWFTLHYLSGGTTIVMLLASLAYIVKNQPPAKFIGIGLLYGATAIIAGSALLRSFVTYSDPILLYTPIFEILSAIIFSAYDTIIFIIELGIYLFGDSIGAVVGFALLGGLLAVIFAVLMKIKLPGGETMPTLHKASSDSRNTYSLLAATAATNLSISIDNEKTIDLNTAFENQQEKIQALYSHREKLLAAIQGKISEENLELLRSALAAFDFSIAQVHKTTISTSYGQGVAPITTVHSGGYTSVMGGGTQVYEFTNKNENQYYKIVVRNGSRHNADIIIRGRVKNPDNINNYGETFIATRIEAGEGSATTIGIEKSREIRDIDITLQQPTGERKIHVRTADTLSQINDLIGQKVKIKKDERAPGTAAASMIAKIFKTIILTLIGGYMLLGGLAWCGSKGFF